MAKNSPGEIAGPGKQPLMARLDIKKATEVGDVELGEEVCVVIEGKVKGMRGPDEHLYGKEKTTYPGSVDIEITKMTIKPIGEFDAMMDEE